MEPEGKDLTGALQDVVGDLDVGNIIAGAATGMVVDYACKALTGKTPVEHVTDFVSDIFDF